MDDEELDNVIVLNDEDGNEVNFEFLDLVELSFRLKILIQKMKNLMLV